MFQFVRNPVVLHDYALIRLRYRAVPDTLLNADGLKMNFFLNGREREFGLRIKIAIFVSV